MTLEELARTKGFSVAELTKFHVRDDLLGERVEIPYFDSDGVEYERVRLRFGDRKFLWSPGNEPLHLYGLWRPVPWDKPVIICEGESDCWSLWLNHVPAIGVPGASNYKLLNGSIFSDVKTLAIAEEPDEAGKSFAFDAAQQLFATGYKGEIYTIKFMPHKDARQAYNKEPEMMAHFYDGYVWRRRTKIEKAPPANGPRVFTFDEVDAMPQETHDWRIDGLVHEEGVVIVAARPKIGKSTLLRNMSLALARGEPFLGRVTKQCAVLWLALEESKSDVIEHFKKLGIAKGDAVGFHFGDPPRKALEWLNEVAEGYGAIVIDTLGKFFPQLINFNDYGEVNRHMRPMERFAHETHRTIFFAHHAGWAGEVRAQGSTAFAGAADCMLLLSEHSLLMRKLTSVQRGGDPFDKALLQFDRATDRVTLTGELHALTVETIEARILALFNGQSLTREQILRSTGSNSVNGREALVRLIERGDLVMVGGRGVRGKPAEYMPKGAGSVVAFPELRSLNLVDTECNTLHALDLEKTHNGPGNATSIIIVGGVRDDAAHVHGCAVCHELRAHYDLVDGRAWCTVCYDAGRRPEST